MKKFILVCITLLFATGAFQAVSAQGLLERAAQRARDRIVNRTEQKIDEAIDKAIDKGFDAVEDAVTGSGESDDSRSDRDADVADTDEEVQQESVETSSVKNDFVRGEVIMFEDDMQGEQVGEFPSKWDLERGNAEIATVSGQTCIAMMGDDSWITPLVKGGIKNYLGDVFTVEYDMLFKKGDGGTHIEFDIMHESERRDNELFTIEYNFIYDKTSVNCNYVRPNAEGYTNKEGSADAHDVAVINDGRWHHFALSFNKRAIKFYIDGKRVVNVPNAKSGAGWLTWWCGGGTIDNPVYMRNVVIAKGAVELYERQATDIDAKIAAVEKAIEETGKFVTNNILFETGKADLKPESMEEIEKVAEYMKKNPSVRFEVQGHTDNQGSDAINDPLSQQRAEAVVKALAGLGVDDFNLKAVGKGSHEPVADNTTEEGRAKNRRVVFVKR